MHITDPKHPIWPILTQSASALVIIIACTCLYSAGFVPKDAMLLIGNSTALLVVQLLKKVITTPSVDLPS